MLAIKIADWVGNLDTLLSPPDWLSNPFIMLVFIGVGFVLFYHSARPSEEVAPVVYLADGSVSKSSETPLKLIVQTALASMAFGFIILGPAILLGFYLRQPVKPSQRSQGTPKKSEAVPTNEALHGVLIPAIDPMPKTDCPVWPDANVLFLGDSVFFTNDRLAAIRVDGNEIISFKETPAGIYISANVYSQANKVIVQITDNELFVNPGNIFHSSRPDWHTLVITDNIGIEVLRVAYINKQAIKIVGTFSSPNLGRPIFIKEDRLEICNQAFSAACMGQPQGAVLECKNGALAIGLMR